MYSTELMVKEHDNILRFNQTVRKACIGILEGKEINTEDFTKMIDFARNYADKHHHGKEEQILFKEMTTHLGHIGVNLIQNGMLVEHDLGRLHISELEKAIGLYKENKKSEYKLDIIANAVSYTNLLQRHIDKENEVVYSYAEKSLSKDILQSVDERTKEFEREAVEKNIPQKYLQFLDELVQKYWNE